MRRGMAICAAILLGAASPNFVAAQQQKSGPSVLVQLTTLRKGSLPRIVTAYGRAEADPAAQRTVTAPAAAVIGAVYVRLGQKVGKDDPLIRLGPSPATAAAYAQAVSAVRVAADVVRRTRQLAAQHLATAQQLATDQKSESDARSALAALTAEGAGSPQILRAPFPAIVTAVSANPGAIVAQGAALIDLAQPDALVLRAEAMPAQAAAIEPGDAATITPLGTRDAVAGRVVLRGSMVDPQTGLVPVFIAPPRGMLLPGETAEARIATGETRGYVVPHSAILVDNVGAPYVVQAVDRIARKIPVRILESGGGMDVVAGPLDPAAPLVLAGNYQLDDGMRVRVAAPDGAGK